MLAFPPLPVRCRPFRSLPGLLCCLFVVAPPAVAGPPDGDGSYRSLLALFEEFQAARPPVPLEGIEHYRDAAIAGRREALQAMQRRLDDMGVARWPVPQQVDFLTVRAELDQHEFILAVTRPWSRDPTFYFTGLLPAAFTALPVSGAELEKLRRTLRAVPALLDAARERLTEVAGDYADLAIRSLTQSDGIEDDYPVRETPPAGIIGWYEDLLGRAGAQPALERDISRALAALRDFHQWLVEHRGSMTAQNGVGKEALDWFVRHGLLLPYTSEEMAVLSQREIDRFWAFYALEQHRNRDLPELAMADSNEEYLERLADTDRLIRRFMEDEAFLTVPAHIPDDWREIGYGVPWIARATPPNFWEQVQYRDPAPDHLHAVIPGHRFDAMVAAQIDNPIRRELSFGARWQGWAVYLEEAPLQLGIFEQRPRTRELIYVFGLWRAARALGDIYNQWNEMSAAETAEFWLEITPFLDADVARRYAYLRPAPGHGLEYTIGNIQMFRLLAERKRQLGDDFVLREFHDEFMSKGRIPIAAIHYEMTGDAAAVERFWERTPLSSLERATAMPPP